MPDAAVPGSAGAADQLAAELWAFSLDLYARPGVAETCLALQDRHALDVNLVLLCCWFGASGRGRLDAADLATLEAAAAPWREQVLVPLRAARRGLKSMPGEGASLLYRGAKDLELDAEREAQRRLVAALLGRPTVSTSAAAADAAASLACYLTAHGVGAEAGHDILAVLSLPR